MILILVPGSVASLDATVGTLVVVLDRLLLPCAGEFLIVVVVVVVFASLAVEDGIRAGTLPVLACLLMLVPSAGMAMQEDMLLLGTLL